MRAENQPRLQLGLTVTTRQKTGEAVCTVWVLDAEGWKAPLFRYEWASGRPSPSDLEDVTAALMNTASSQLVTELGVQGVLGGT